MVANKKKWNGLDDLEPPEDFWEDTPTEDDFEMHYDDGDYDQEQWHRTFASTGSISLDPDWFD